MVYRGQQQQGWFDFPSRPKKEVWPFPQNQD